MSKYPKARNRSGIPRRHRRTWYTLDRYKNRPGYLRAQRAWMDLMCLPIVRPSFPHLNAEIDPLADTQFDEVRRWVIERFEHAVRNPQLDVPQ